MTLNQAAWRTTLCIGLGVWLAACGSVSGGGGGGGATVATAGTACAGSGAVDLCGVSAGHSAHLHCEAGVWVEVLACTASELCTAKSGGVFLCVPVVGADATSADVPVGDAPGASDVTGGADAGGGTDATAGDAVLVDGNESGGDAMGPGDGFVGADTLPDSWTPPDSYNPGDAWPPYDSGSYDGWDYDTWTPNDGGSYDGWGPPDVNYGSCWGYCGLPYSSGSCACDINCGIYGTCCDDYWGYCLADASSWDSGYPTDAGSWDSSSPDGYSLYGSCAGWCGSPYSSGTCACDPWCGNYGNCCDDYDAMCTGDASISDGSSWDAGSYDAGAWGSCWGYCGLPYSNGSCACDPNCLYNGTCCPDILSACMGTDAGSWAD